MSCVYWIRKKDFKDVFSEGYVGVTSKTAEERFDRHYQGKKSFKGKLYNTLNKYPKDDFIVETICISDSEYCYWLENQLRPIKNLGWNIAIGGSKPPSPENRVWSEKSRQKLSDSLKGKTSEARKQATKKLGIKRKGLPKSKSSVDKYNNFLNRVGPWKYPSANTDFWSQADTYYSEYLSGKNAWSVSKLCGVGYDQLKTIFKYFSNGWIPMEDARWVEYFKIKIEKY